MIKLFKLNMFFLPLTILFCFNNVAIAQKKGIKKAEFLPEKVIITEEIDAKGESETKEKQVEAPKGYTAIRGDEFTLAFPLSKFDHTGDNEQTIPVVNLSYKALHHWIVTFVGKDTIQLPDQVFAITNHYTSYREESMQPEDKTNIWIDDRGFLVLSTMIYKKEQIMFYQEAYDKDKNKGGNSFTIEWTILWLNRMESF